MTDVVPKHKLAGRRMRKFTRYRVNLRITVDIFRSGKKSSLWGRSNEFGEDGVGATLTGEIEAGEVVALELTVPAAAAPLKIRAVVRYRDGLRHGFEFLTKTPAQADLIRRICEHLALRE
jgi:PilZ domain-containing protein